MTEIGAIVRPIIKFLDEATSAAILGLRLAFGGRRPKPCPIPVTIPSRRKRA